MIFKGKFSNGEPQPDSEETTKPPQTQAPETEPPQTQAPPETEPPQTQAPPETEPPQTQEPQPDPPQADMTQAQAAEAGIARNRAPKLSGRSRECSKEAVWEAIRLFQI